MERHAAHFSCGAAVLLELVLGTLGVVADETPSGRLRHFFLACSDNN